MSLAAKTRIETGLVSAGPAGAVAAAADIPLGPIAVAVRTQDQAIDEVVMALNSQRAAKFGFANTNMLSHAMRNPAYADELAGFTLYNDGIGLTLAAKIAAGRSFQANLNGTDFTPALLAACPAGTKVFLLGAKPEVVRQAASHCQERFTQLQIVGFCDGYSCHRQDQATAAAAIQSSGADLVLVAMGNPLQERWIAAVAADKGPGPVWIGVGALFDFMAGNVPRAPQWMRAAKLEWAFRLMQEPGRLWRRYTVEVGGVLLASVRWGLQRRFGSGRTTAI
jgi:alpha-1,3-mannosyltransferase